MVLQSINESYQEELFNFLKKFKKKSSIIAIEVRTDNDNIKKNEFEIAKY